MVTIWCRACYLQVLLQRQATRQQLSDRELQGSSLSAQLIAAAPAARTAPRGGVGGLGIHGGGGGGGAGGGPRLIERRMPLPTAMVSLLGGQHAREKSISLLGGGSRVYHRAKAQPTQLSSAQQTQVRSNPSYSPLT
jgi:hypothetical protein